MTAKEYLSQAYWLDKQIDAKIEQISDLRELTQKVTAMYEGEVVSRSRNLTALQDTIARIMDAEAEINRQIDQLVELKGSISKLLKGIHNDGYRVVLEERYLCFKSWDAIAKELDRSRRCVLEWHERALRIVERLMPQIPGAI